MSGSIASSRFAIIIPARAASSRYPGKPLAMLRGLSGLAKPLIQRSWDCAMRVDGASGVFIATDDDAIAEAVRGFGGQVVMTSATCRNGTERCAEAVAKLEAELGAVLDIIVNLQGDAPLTPAYVVEALVAALAGDGRAAMATAAMTCSHTSYAHLREDAKVGRTGGTTVVTSASGYALYFSKAVIPFVPSGPVGAPLLAHSAVRLHLGLYAYRPSALAAYAATPPSPLEELEGLEQLRFLEGDAPVRVVSFAPPDWDCIELNNPHDVPIIEANLRKARLE